ncbi:hypothetical protein RRG08_058808 [Elysia crispata]|uniref:Uncharacterized protein n=1 Tax=Elysia crispata TaxID=231223 RepID=A0AAE0YXP2_9GAST|nr:hypothetical protein RRG08_058808 [Elysia crispata]
MRAYSGAITGLEDLSAVNFGSNSEDILGCCLMFLFPERLLQEERDLAEVSRTKCGRNELISCERLSRFTSRSLSQSSFTGLCKILDSVRLNISSFELLAPKRGCEAHQTSHSLLARALRYRSMGTAVLYNTPCNFNYSLSVRIFLGLHVVETERYRGCFSCGQTQTAAAAYNRDSAGLTEGESRRRWPWLLADQAKRALVSCHEARITILGQESGLANRTMMTTERKVVPGRNKGCLATSEKQELHLCRRNASNEGRIFFGHSLEHCRDWRATRGKGMLPPHDLDEFDSEAKSEAIGRGFNRI